MEWTCKYCESINEGNKCFYCGAPREKITNKDNLCHDILEISETSYHFYGGDLIEEIWSKNADGTIGELIKRYS